MVELHVGRFIMKRKILRDYGFNTDNSTYIIAEIGINHGGNIETAKRLIESAAKTGCDAVKFQTYITEKRVSQEKNGLFNLLKECELPFSDFNKLKRHSNDFGLEFFSTPFDKESLEYLESIDTNIYKIASFDVVNKSLILALSATEKTIIISVGMASYDEIKEAFDLLDVNDNKIAILHCVSAYPADEKDANLRVINSLQDKYNSCVIGYSDHTSGIKTALYSVAAGAQIIEKHYKISNNMDCIDASVSITEQDMSCLVDETRMLEIMLGSGDKRLVDAEKEITQFRRYS